MNNIGNSIIDYLLLRANLSPDKTAYILLKDGETTEKRLSYLQLLNHVEALAPQLTAAGLKNKRVLLAYQDSLEFITAFLACQYAGIIPVPVPYAKGSKQLLRLTGIIENAQADALLCAANTITYLAQYFQQSSQFAKVQLIATDAAVQPVSVFERGYHEIAFIQYTSGSTGHPKGVVVLHQNLLHNQQLIQHTFHTDEQSVIVSWLPFHHDMGLIGNLLHTLYVGGTGVLMSPFHFVQKPLRWLLAIQQYKATHSGGPNFAFDLCINKISKQEAEKLDLSSWRVAFNGSEPVRADTITRFSEYFKPAGFTEHAFFPCYGLAEATLLVSGVKENRQAPTIIYLDKELLQQGKIKLVPSADTTAKALVSSGRIAPGMDVKIISLPDGRVAAPLEQGEVCIAGDSVTGGYWQQEHADLFCTIDGRSYLKTGDRGLLYKKELFIEGRSKDLLIIRGANFYPYDIEQLVSAEVLSIEPNGVAVFGNDNPAGTFVVAAEMKRDKLVNPDSQQIINAIDQAVTTFFGLVPYDILLLSPQAIPRTTSGKIQRSKCTKLYKEGAFETIASRLELEALVKPLSTQNSHPSPVLIKDGDGAAIRAYLVALIAEKAGHSYADRIHDDAELTEIGIDSLRAMELVNTINKDLDINMDAARVFQHNTFSGLFKNIEQLMWLKTAQNAGNEIII
jgi:acyl-CoA synthetase (AMP-forming)/AMP-acid ligase II/acyl carrier protein